MTVSLGFSFRTWSSGNAFPGGYEAADGPDDRTTSTAAVAAAEEMIAATLAAVSNMRAISFLPKYRGAPRTRLPKPAGKGAKRRVLIVG